MGVNEKGRSEKVSTSVPLGTFEALNNLTLLLSLFLLFKNSEKKILPVRPKLMFKMETGASSKDGERLTYLK